MKLWIVCTCGRNLANVTRKKVAPSEWDRIPRGWALSSDGLYVSSRMAAFRPGAGEPITYTWPCRCGKNWTRRHTWIAAKWAGFDRHTRVARVIIDS